MGFTLCSEIEIAIVVACKKQQKILKKNMERYENQMRLQTLVGA